MGLSASRPETPRSVLEDLKQDLHRMSAKVDTWLPWIALVRNGAAVVMFAGAAAMLAATCAARTEYFDHARKVAGTLALLGFLLHLLSFILREAILIRRISGHLQRFDAAKPARMYTDNKVPRPRSDGLHSGLLLLEAGSIAASFITWEEAEWAPPLIAFLLLLFCAPVFCRKIIKDRNDFHLKAACQTSADILHTLLNARQDARV